MLSAAQHPTDGPSRGPTWQAHLIPFLAVILGYGLIHAVLRLSLSSVIAVDDVVEVVFTQSLDWGYDSRQPPLYTWILWAVSQIGHIDLSDILLVKYGLLAVTLLTYRHIVLLVLEAETRQADPGNDSGLRSVDLAVWANFAALSILLLYQIGWNIHEGVTHTLTLMTACALALWLFLRLMERRSLGGYLLFGVVLGLGFLSKYGFPAFLFCLVVAGLSQRAGRRVLADWRMLLVLGIVAAMVFPYGQWLQAQGETSSSLYRLNAEDPLRAYFSGVAMGLGRMVTAILGFLAPLLPLMILVYPRAFRFWRWSWRLRQEQEQAPACFGWQGSSFLGVFLLAAVAVLVFGVVVTGVTNYKERWMHPLMLPAIPWLWLLVWRMYHGGDDSGRASGWLQRLRPSGRRHGVMAGLLLFSLGLVVVVRALQFVIGPPSCGKCRLSVPYDHLAQALRQAGFEQGLLIGFDEHIAGNLRVRFPTQDVISDHTDFYHPPLRSGTTGDCALVWDRDRFGDSVPREAAPYLDLAPEALAGLPVTFIDHAYDVPCPVAEARQAHWGLTLVPGRQCHQQ